MYTNSPCASSRHPKLQRSARTCQAGISLIELIIFIVIVSVGLVGILSVMNTSAKSSADPMVLKQATAIAESLMEEIQLQPYTLCDPDDPAVTTATILADCTVQAEGPGPEPAETRYGPAFFDNVNDYQGLNLPAILDIDGNLIAGLGNYAATVTVTPAAVAGITALRIDVTVTSGTTVNVQLTGYRAMYAPNAGP